MAVTDTDLYRFLHKTDWPNRIALIVDDKPTPGLLYPQFESKIIQSGSRRQERAPDVDLGIDPKTGEAVVKSGGGTSLWDKDGVLKGSWRTFKIPTGTVIPESLKVKKGYYNRDKQATHYQIEVMAGQIAIDGFKGALDNLARNAVVRAIELAKG